MDSVENGGFKVPNEVCRQRTKPRKSKQADKENETVHSTEKKAGDRRHTMAKKKCQKKSADSEVSDGELRALLAELDFGDNIETDCNLDETLAGLVEDLEYCGAKNSNESKRQRKPVELLGVRSAGNGSIKLDSGSLKKKHNSGRQCRQTDRFLNGTAQKNSSTKLVKLECNLDATKDFTTSKKKQRTGKTHKVLKVDDLDNTEQTKLGKVDPRLSVKEGGAAVEFKNSGDSIPMGEEDVSLNETLVEFLRNLSDGEGNAAVAGAISGTSDLNLSDVLSQLVENVTAASESSKLSISNSSVIRQRGCRKKKKGRSAGRSKKGSSSSDQSLSSNCISEKSLDDIAQMLEDLKEESNDVHVENSHQRGCRKKKKGRSAGRSKKVSSSSDQSLSSTCISEKSLDDIAQMLEDLQEETNDVHVENSSGKVQKKDVVVRSEGVVCLDGDSQGLFRQACQEEDSIPGAPSAISEGKNSGVHMALYSSLEPELMNLENPPVSVDNQLPSLPFFSSLDTEQSLPVCQNLNQYNASSADVPSKSDENGEHSFAVHNREKSVSEEKFESMPLFSSLDSEQSLGIAMVTSNTGQTLNYATMACLDKYSQLIPNMDVPGKREKSCEEPESMPLFSSLDSEQSQPVVDTPDMKLNSLNSIPYSDSSFESIPKTEHLTVKKMPRIKSLSGDKSRNLPLFTSLDSSGTFNTNFIGIVKPENAVLVDESLDSSCDVNEDSCVPGDSDKITGVAETDDEDVAMSSSAGDSGEQDPSCDGVCPESDISSASEYLASPVADLSLTSPCLASREANMSCGSVVSSNFNKSRGSLDSLGSSIGSYRELINSPEQEDLANTVENVNMLSFLSNGSPVVQSGSYTELIKSGNKQMTPDPKQVKKGLSTSTPVGENQKKMYETISAESPALKQNVFTDMSPALAKHSPLCREVVKRVTDRSPCSSSTRTPCNTKDKKPMFESPMLLKNGTGSPVVSRNSPKPTGSPMVLKNTSKTAGSCLVTAKEGPKPTRSPMVISRDSPRIAARDSPRKNGYPMVLRESPRKTGSPMVLRDSPRKTGSPMVLRESPRKTGSPMVLKDSPRKTGSPMVLRDSPRKTGSPMVLRDSPRKTGSPMVLRDSPRKTGSPMVLRGSPRKTGSPMVLRDSPRKTGSQIVTARDSPKLAGSPMQLKVSTKKIEKVILVNRMESSGNCEEMQTSTDEDGFVETVEGSSEEKNLQISFPSLDESSKVNEDSDSSGQNHSKEISEEINEGSVGESPSLNKSSESNETDRSSVVESLSLDNSSRLNEVSSVVDMSHDSIVCVAEKSLQVSFASEDDSKEGDVCPMDDVCLKLDDCSMVDVCDEICQVSMSSCAGSGEGSENHETVINKAGTSKIEMSGCLDLENSVSASPSSVKIEQTDVNIMDKSMQVSFSSQGSDQPASWDSENSASQGSEKFASEDSCQSEESEKKSEESAESNQSVEDGSVVTQIQNKPGKTKHSDPQSTLDTTVYEDALTSQLTGRKSTQSWRSQPALSSDEDAQDPNPHRPPSRKSKKQATAALAKVFDTSSSDDLDDFFNKMKTPAKKQSESDDDDDLSDFVVSDGEMSFETADESPEDDEVFYINTGRLIEEAESVRKPPKKTPGAILTGKKSTKPLNTSKRKKALYNDGLSPLGDFRRTRPVPTMQQNLFCEEPSDDDVRSRKKQAAASFVDMNGESDDNLDDFKTPCPPPKVKPSRKTTASKPNYIKLSSDDDEVDEDFKTPALPPKDKPSRTTKNPKAKYIDLSSDSDDMEDFKTPGFLPPLKSDSAPNLPKAGTNTPAFRMPAAVKMKGAKTVATMRCGITTDKKPTATFLRSLSLDVQSDRRHPEAHKFVTNFKSTKEVLTKKLFDLYSSTVFENKLPDFPIIWNSRLTKTAGYCAYSRERPTMVFKCRIELSVKVCDSAECLRDTLIHEMCHAAVWLLNGKKDGHGPIWKTWAQRANMVHSELPIIRRCHSYSVETKYIYKCSKCGYQIGRHSKSLDTAGKVCGYCRGHFELYVNGKNGLKKALGSTTKTPNKFAMFVKENYGSIKSSNQKSKHKDIMKLLSSEFAKTKISFS